MFSKVTMISMFRSTALAAIAAGLALTSPAHANMISNFSGTCTALCTGSTSGVLTLTDAYVPGTNIILQPASFVSFLELTTECFAKGLCYWLQCDTEEVKCLVLDRRRPGQTVSG